MSKAKVTVTDEELERQIELLDLKDVPAKLICASCSKFVGLNVFRTPCCEQSICQSCKDAIIEGSACQVCDHKPLDPADVKPYKSQRLTVRAFLKGELKKRQERGDKARREKEAQEAQQRAEQQLDQASATQPEIIEQAVAPVQSPDVAALADEQLTTIPNEQNAVATVDNLDVRETPLDDQNKTSENVEEQSDPMDIPIADRNHDEPRQQVESPQQVQHEQDEKEQQNSNHALENSMNYGGMPQGMQWQNTGNMFNPMMAAQFGMGFPNMMGYGMGMDPSMMMGNGMFGGFNGMNMNMNMAGMNGMNGMGINGGYGSWDDENSMNGINDDFGDYSGYYQGNNYNLRGQRGRFNQRGYRGFRSRGRGNFGQGFGRGQGTFMPGVPTGPRAYQALQQDFALPNTEAEEASPATYNNDSVNVEAAQYQQSSKENGKLGAGDGDADATGQQATMEQAGGVPGAPATTNDDVTADGHPEGLDEGTRAAQPGSGDSAWPDHGTGEDDNANLNHQGMYDPQQHSLQEAPVAASAPLAPRGPGFARGGRGFRGGLGRGRGGFGFEDIGRVPEAPGAGVEGAPKGPKAMREGQPNTGFRGRGSGGINVLGRGRAIPTGPSRQNSGKLTDVRPQSRASSHREHRALSTSGASHDQRDAVREQNDDDDENHGSSRRSRRDRDRGERSSKRHRRRRRSRSPSSDRREHKSSRSGRRERDKYRDRDSSRRRDRSASTAEHRDRDRDHRSQHRREGARRASGVDMSNVPKGPAAAVSSSSSSIGKAGAPGQREFKIKDRSKRTELDIQRELVREEKPDIDQHALEREARNRERMLREQERRGSYGLDGSEEKAANNSRKRRAADDGYERGKSSRRESGKSSRRGAALAAAAAAAYFEEDGEARARRVEKEREEERWR